MRKITKVFLISLGIYISMVIIRNVFMPDMGLAMPVDYYAEPNILRGNLYSALLIIAVVSFLTTIISGFIAFISFVVSKVTHF